MLVAECRFALQVLLELWVFLVRFFEMLPLAGLEDFEANVV